MSRPADASTRSSSRSHALRIALRSFQMLQGALLGLGAFLAALARERQWAAAAGAGLVRAFTHLGATFIKVGQIASTRGDLLPPPLVRELARLQDDVPAFPFAEVEAIIASELGRPLEEIYAEFDPVPVAAVSVAQVHRAVLREPRAAVAVKVRRPDILERIQLDRSILLLLARVAERIVPTFRLLSLEASVEQFCAAVEAQTHLRHEAENNAEFARNFADDEDIQFPRVHPGASSDAVLTMDFVEDVREADLEARGVDVTRVVMAGMRAICRMVFSHGFVHADVHPGNVRFRPPGSVVFLDLGLVGRLEDEDRVTTARLLFALATGDGATVARLFYDNAPYRGTRDYAAYERDICDFVASVQDKGLAHLQVTLEIGRIFDILRRHRIHARAHMTMVNLALMTAEGLGKRLAPQLSLTDEALPYLAEALGVPAPTRSAS